MDLERVADEQHLDADEAEDDAEADVQVAELALHAAEQEVQRPQAEDGEGVGGEHDERLAADGEDGRHRVDGEDHVGRLDQHQHGEQRRGDPLGVLAGEQLLAVVLVGGRHDLRTSRMAMLLL